MSNLIISKKLSRKNEMVWFKRVLTYYNHGDSNLRFCYQLEELRQIPRGIFLDRWLRFGEHIAYATKKVRTFASALVKILPNVNCTGQWNWLLLNNNIVLNNNMLTALCYTELLSGGLLFKWSTIEENPRRICVLRVLLRK